ncbi:MAG: hypothetical protein JNM24_17815, partial [Bdellovibrionaceae bacterium]|nr:hypothetical protein [Pseudobdellovibrionaceae bacterium]
MAADNFVKTQRLLQSLGLYKRKGLDFLSTSRGASLIEILISIGILGILSVAFMNTLLTQQKQIRHLSQKQEIADLKSYIQSTFTNSDSCSCSLRPTDVSTPGTLVFNSTIVDGSLSMSIPQIKEGCSVGAANIIKAGELIPGTQTQLRVKDINLVEIKPGGNPLEWYGFIQVSFDPSSTAFSLKPLQIKQRFTIDTVAPSTASNRLVKSCISTDRLEFGDYIDVPQNTVQVAPCDGFLSTQTVGNGLTTEHGYICAGTDFNKVTECYGYDGGGPGASTILSRMLVYSGTMAMIKKGYFYQVQYL